MSNNEDFLNDDVFAAFVNNAEAEKAKEKARKENGGFTPREYEQPQWVGLKDNEANIIRIVGNPPESMTHRPSGKYDSKEFFFSQIIDDNGKRMQLRLPCHAEDKNHEHIMWRIINTVKEVKWEKGGSKTFVNQNYPWFDKVNHGGYDPIKEQFQYKISKGWSGQQVVVMNVIDREDDWCVTNKHTKLLSKKVNVSQGADGKTKEYPTIGVPSYGFLTKLAAICGKDGGWNKYDLSILRTGQMEEPYDIKNATKFKKVGFTNEFDKTGNLTKFVSLNEDYTEEEKNYERYDIEKMFSPTTYSKILNHLGNTIKAIDADKKTNYFEELQALVEEEKKKFAELYPQSNSDTNETTSTGSVNVNAMPNEPANDPLDPMSQPAPEVTPAQPTVTRNIVRESTVAPAQVGGLSPEKIALLKGWNELLPNEKEAISDVELNVDGTLKNIIYKDEAGNCVACNKADGGCGFSSPLSFLHCPVCGVAFQ